MDNSSYFSRSGDTQQQQTSGSTSPIPSTSSAFSISSSKLASAQERLNAMNPTTASNNPFSGLNSSYSNGQSSFGPVKRSTSSLRAHRSSMYSRPNFSMNTSSSSSYISNRYFGNSSAAGRSVLLGAKKSAENVPVAPLQPELTATARRIIDNLHTVSAPVLNKEKFGMDCIKSFRPDLSSLKRKEPSSSSSGPPIHLSPMNIEQPLPLKTARMDNNIVRETSFQDEEYQFSDAWSFEDIENGVRHLPKQNVDFKYLMKLYEDKKKSEDNTANKPLMKLNNDSQFMLNTAIKTALARPAITMGDMKPPSQPIAKTDQDAKWECPVCMVNNKLQDSACVCCGEKNPNAQDAKWECPVCMVNNRSQDSACVCCGEKNPKATSSSSSSVSNEGNKTGSDFKFGFAAPAAGSTTNSNFVFGGADGGKVDKPPQPASNFQFGFSAASNKPKSEATPSTTTTTPGSFQSGSNKIDSDSKSTSSNTFTLGGTKNQQTTTQTPVNNSEKFSFGLTDADKEQFESGIKVQPLSGFRFGTAPAKPTVTNDKTATKSSPEQTWRCSVCQDSTNSMTTLKCKGCDAMRPNPESNSFKWDSNVKKDYSFQPYPGLPDQQNVQKPPAPAPFVSKLPTNFTPFATSQTPTTPAAASTSALVSPQQPPQFGSTSPATTASSPIKRKAVTETFVYTPEEPKLKLKSPPPPSTSEIQPAGNHSAFIDAIKRQRGEDVPDTASKSGGIAIPTTTTAAPSLSSSTSTTNSLSTSVTTPAATSASAPATTTAITPKPFSFQSLTTPATSNSTPTTTSLQSAPVPIFGASPAPTATVASTTQSLNTTAQASNIFGAPSSASTISTSSGFGAPAPTFGSPPPVFQFGQQPATSTPFVFGGAAATTAAVTAPPAIATTTSASSPFMFGQTTTPGAGGLGGGFRPTFAQSVNAGPPIFGQPASSTMMQPTFGSPAPNMFNAGGNTGFGAQPAAPAGQLFGMPPIPTGNNLQPQAPGSPGNFPQLFNLGSGERRIKKATRRLR